MKNAHLKYNSFTEVLKKKYQTRIFKITLNAGLTCPNRDGKLSKRGCSYCNDDYLLAKSWHKQQPLMAQINYGRTYIQERHKAEKFFAYFQNGTNTYASIKILRKIFYTVLGSPDIVGMIIGTRADCLPENVLDLLSEINLKTDLWIDLGLQSTQNKILNKVNRGHSIDDFSVTVANLANRNIQTCAHIILGMPEETNQEALLGVNIINKLPIKGLKIHNMLVTKDTEMATWFEQGTYTPLSLEEYVTLCVDYLECLRPDIIIHRLNAHAPARLTVAPQWSINKLGTLNAIHKEIVRRGTWQGKRLSSVV
ncbi:MAG: TIGR01212 family radical SAM protein [bacterium]|nr:TIGR01212 family radical SAM protein [bacterium]